MLFANCPGAQLKQAANPSEGENLPVEQPTHVAENKYKLECCPAAHAMHSIARVFWAKVPGGHPRHIGEPAMGAKDPRTHGVQDADAKYRVECCPGTHARQSVEPEFSEYHPPAQLVQFDAAGRDENVPATQELQLAAPAKNDACPGRQGSQLDAPLLGLYKPAPQLWQCFAPIPENKPAAQVKQLEVPLNIAKVPAAQSLHDVDPLLDAA